MRGVLFRISLSSDPLYLAALQAEALLQAERKRVEELQHKFEREAEDSRAAEQKRSQELRSKLEKEKGALLAAERKRSEELLHNTKKESADALQSARKQIEEIQNTHQKEKNDLDLALQNERRTVTFLVTEKANLTAELEKRDDLESSASPCLSIPITFLF